jgi:hypothetical protein
MKKLLHICLLLCVAATVAAQENQKILKVYDWKDLSAQIPNSQIVSMDGMSVLKIENTNASRLELSLVTITNASLIQKTTLASYEIKYENVVQDYDKTPLGGGRISYGAFRGGELSLLRISPSIVAGGDKVTNHFSADFFEGTSNWKRFQIEISKTTVQPTKMELRIYLPSTGTVYLRPIKLLGVASSGWWSAKQGAIAGGAVGIFGGIIGCFGGVLGCLAGFGKARKFVMTTTKTFIALGMLLTITGIVAIACGQPFFVWYIFLLPGVVLTLIFSLNFPLIQRRYDDLEIRRMASIDAMGS